MRILIIWPSIVAIAFAFPAGPVEQQQVQQTLTNAPVAPLPANTFFFTPFVGLPPQFNLGQVGLRAHQQPTAEQTSLLSLQQALSAPASQQKSHASATAPVPLPAALPAPLPAPVPLPAALPAPLPAPLPVPVQPQPQLQSLVNIHHQQLLQPVPALAQTQVSSVQAVQGAEATNLVASAGSASGSGQVDATVVNAQIQAQPQAVDSTSNLVELARAYTESNLRLAQAYREAEVRLAAANQKEASEALLAQAIAGANAAGNVQLLNVGGGQSLQGGGSSGGGASDGSGSGSSQNGGSSGSGSGSDGSSSGGSGGSSQNGDGSSSSQNGDGSSSGVKSTTQIQLQQQQQLLQSQIPHAFPFQFFSGLPSPVHNIQAPVESGKTAK